ncbi:MAG: DpnD/PcfM family protein [Muricomes sp.]
MKKYEVTITETLQKTVSIRAESRSEAEEIAQENWNNSEYVLSAEEFQGVEFQAEEHSRPKDLER